MIKEVRRVQKSWRSVSDVPCSCSSRRRTPGPSRSARQDTRTCRRSGQSGCLKRANSVASTRPGKTPSSRRVVTSTLCSKSSFRPWSRPPSWSARSPPRRSEGRAERGAPWRRYVDSGDGVRDRRRPPQGSLQNIEARLCSFVSGCGFFYLFGRRACPARGRTLPPRGVPRRAPQTWRQTPTGSREDRRGTAEGRPLLGPLCTDNRRASQKTLRPKSTTNVVNPPTARNGHYLQVAQGRPLDRIGQELAVVEELIFSPGPVRVDGGLVGMVDKPDVVRRKARRKDEDDEQDPDG
jgi:hypothetical protein